MLSRARVPCDTHQSAGDTLLRDPGRRISPVTPEKIGSVQTDGADLRMRPLAFRLRQIVLSVASILAATSSDKMTK